METLSTIIEFVGSGTGCGGRAGSSDIAAAASGTSAAGDPLFVVCTVITALLAIAASIFVYSKYQQRATHSENGMHVCPSVSDIDKHGMHGLSSKTNPVALLAIAVCLIVALAGFAIDGHNKALADDTIASANSGIATISDKVTANVDDSGNVEFSKGVITNNNDELYIGVRQVASESDVDLSDAILTISCNDEELYNKKLGETQLNDNYIKVAVGESSDLTYKISMSAQKAKELVGTSPVILYTDVDLICSKPGVATNSTQAPVGNATVEYSYTDPYDKTKTISATLTTKDDGKYTIPDVKQGTVLNLTITYDESGRTYFVTQTVVVEDETQITQDIPIMEPQSSDFVFNAPGGGQPIVYDGNEKVVSFSESQTCPTGMGKATPEYSTNPSDPSSWTINPLIYAGTYYVRANVEKGTGVTAKIIENNDKWNFTINKADNPIEVTASQSNTTTYDSTNDKTATITTATKAQGTVTYLIKNTVSGFSLSGTTLTCAKGTNANESGYAITITATAAGNDNYKPGSKDIAYTWKINKAENNIQFTLTTTTGTSEYSATNDAKQQIEAAKNAPTSEGDKLTYSVTNKTDEESANFEISVNEVGIPSVVCKAGTPIGEYNLIVQAKSGGKNYNQIIIPETSETKNFTWTVSAAVEKKSIFATYGTQTVIFVPAFAENTAKEYLANVKFYNSSGDEITAITKKINDNSLTMNYLYLNHLKSSVLYDNKIAKVSNSGNNKITFYGVLNEAWSNVFDSATASGVAQNYNTGSSFYNFINDDEGIGTVYFDSKSNHAPRTDWNWNKGTNNCPTLNGVNYSNKGTETSTFYEAYGGYVGGVLSRHSDIPWTSRATGDSTAYNWSAHNDCWRYDRRGNRHGVVVSQAF